MRGRGGATDGSSDGRRARAAKIGSGQVPKDAARGASRSASNGAHRSGPMVNGDGGEVPANLVVLCGRLSSDPQWRELASGSVLWTLEVTTPSEHGAASVPVALFDPAVEPTCVAGDEVYVVGEVRRRFFKGASGTQSRTEVVASEVVRVTQRAKVRASMERLAAVMGRAGGRGLRSP